MSSVVKKVELLVGKKERRWAVQKASRKVGWTAGTLVVQMVELMADLMVGRKAGKCVVLKA